MCTLQLQCFVFLSSWLKYNLQFLSPIYSGVRILRTEMITRKIIFYPKLLHSFSFFSCQCFHDYLISIMVDWLAFEISTTDYFGLIKKFEIRKKMFIFRDLSPIVIGFFHFDYSRILKDFFLKFESINWNYSWMISNRGNTNSVPFISVVPSIPPILFRSLIQLFVGEKIVFAENLSRHMDMKK